MLYQRVAKPVLFRMEPEQAHHLTIGGLQKAGAIPGIRSLLHGLYGVPACPELHVSLWGIDFPNPVGLAAGLDKNADAVKGLSSLGFGFMEVGTVTPQPQPGNESPRLFRLSEDKALINRMGFNNKGAEHMAEALAKAGKRRIPVCVNIGKNKTTSNEEAAEDYLSCIRTLYGHADFFALNISSPNTANLQNLQHGEALRGLLTAVTDEIDKERQIVNGEAKPVLVKISPDLTDVELEAIAETVLASKVSGIIANNTTTNREGLIHPNAKQVGGLSGSPMTKRSNEVVHRLYKMTKGRIPIIGSGGIFTADDAYERIRSGASLVEIFTVLIYEGPEVLRTINEGIVKRMRLDGFTSISQAVGTAQ
ncbi:MAG: quinone-dependent dihydroorotate dehydrogenase [Gorillibacterium sp.]|nr:quinone-dependent dihydroorotate dehydrogenase [Gorillibacterium sp.]